MKYRCIALGLLALTATAQADVKVSFVNPERFSDIRDNNGFRRLEVLKDLEAFLIAEAGKQLPGRDVSFEITDEDLAGEVEPVGRHAQWLRVKRSHTSPAMSFRFEVREGNRVLQQGEARLRDLDYLSGFNVHPDGDPLRFEKRMLERWMSRELAPQLAASAR